MNEILNRIGELGIVPVIKIEDVAKAQPLAEAMCAGGLPLAEITFRTANAEESIRAAVQQSALQCYVVEGAYPPDLKYLEDHYGLRVNTTDYYVVYDAYAENQLPDVRVTKRVH